MRIHNRFMCPASVLPRIVNGAQEYRAPNGLCGHVPMKCGTIHRQPSISRDLRKPCMKQRTMRRARGTNSFGLGAALIFPLGERGGSRTMRAR